MIPKNQRVSNWILVELEGLPETKRILLRFDV